MTIYKCLVTNIIDPHNIWCRIGTEPSLDKLDHFENQVHSFALNHLEKQPEIYADLDNLRAGSSVLAYFKDYKKWRRAVVISISSEEQEVDVHFPDYQFSERLAVTHVLDNVPSWVIALGTQVSRCSLVGVKPIADTWVPRCKNYLKNNLLHERVDVDIVEQKYSHNLDVYIVDILLETENGPRSVSELLVENGLAMEDPRAGAPTSDNNAMVPEFNIERLNMPAHNASAAQMAPVEVVPERDYERETFCEGVDTDMTHLQYSDLRIGGSQNVMSSFQGDDSESIQKMIEEMKSTTDIHQENGSPLAGSRQGVGRGRNQRRHANTNDQSPDPHYVPSSRHTHGQPQHANQRQHRYDNDSSSPASSSGSGRYMRGGGSGGGVERGGGVAMQSRGSDPDIHRAASPAGRGRHRDNRMAANFKNAGGESRIPPRFSRVREERSDSRDRRNASQQNDTNSATTSLAINNKGYSAPQGSNVVKYTPSGLTQDDGPDYDRIWSGEQMPARWSDWPMDNNSSSSSPAAQDTSARVVSASTSAGEAQSQHDEHEVVDGEGEDESTDDYEPQTRRQWDAETLYPHVEDIVQDATEDSLDDCVQRLKALLFSDAECVVTDEEHQALLYAVSQWAVEHQQYKIPCALVMRLGTVDAHFGENLNVTLQKLQAAYMKIVSKGPRHYIGFAEWLAALYVEPQENWDTGKCFTGHVVNTVSHWAVFNKHKKHPQPRPLYDMYTTCLSTFLHAAGLQFSTQRPSEMATILNDVMERAMDADMPYETRRKYMHIVQAHYERQKSASAERVRTLEGAVELLSEKQSKLKHRATQTSHVMTRETGSETDITGPEIMTSHDSAQDEMTSPEAAYSRVTRMLEKLSLMELLPLFQENGIRDSVLALEWGDLKDLLKECGVKAGQVLEIKTYLMLNKNAGIEQEKQKTISPGTNIGNNKKTSPKLSSASPNEQKIKTATDSKAFTRDITKVAPSKSESDITSPKQPVEENLSRQVSTSRSSSKLSSSSNSNEVIVKPGKEHIANKEEERKTNDTETSPPPREQQKNSAADRFAVLAENPRNQSKRSPQGSRDFNHRTPASPRNMGPERFNPRFNGPMHNNNRNNHPRYPGRGGGGMRGSYDDDPYSRPGGARRWNPRGGGSGGPVGGGRGMGPAPHPQGPPGRNERYPPPHNQHQRFPPPPPPHFGGPSPQRPLYNLNNNIPLSQPGFQRHEPRFGPPNNSAPQLTSPNEFTASKTKQQAILEDSFTPGFVLKQLSVTSEESHASSESAHQRRANDVSPNSAKSREREPDLFESNRNNQSRLAPKELTSPADYFTPDFTQKRFDSGMRRDDRHHSDPDIHGNKNNRHSDGVENWDEPRGASHSPRYNTNGFADIANDLRAKDTPFSDPSPPPPPQQPRVKQTQVGDIRSFDRYNTNQRNSQQPQKFHAPPKNHRVQNDPADSKYQVNPKEYPSLSEAAGKANAKEPAIQEPESPDARLEQLKQQYRAKYNISDDAAARQASARFGRSECYRCGASDHLPDNCPNKPRYNIM